MKKAAISALCAVMTAGIFSIAAFAQDADLTVKLTTNDTLEYSGASSYGGTSEYVLGDSFSGILPGESATQTIAILNENGHSAEFFVSAKTLRSLEEANNASGGAYTLKLSVGSTEADAEEIVTSVAGGYNGDTASTKGLSDITELEDYNFVAALKSGESTNLYLTLSLEGEGMDSSSTVDYTKAVAELSMDFRAYYPEDDANTVVRTETVAEDQTITGESKVVVTNNDESDTTDTDEEDAPVTTAAKTGDSAAIGAFAAVLCAGIFLIVVTGKRRKDGEGHE